MGKSVLIVGLDPAVVDFNAPGIIPGMTAEKVWAGLNGSVQRLQAAGHTVRLLMTTDAATVEARLAGAMEGERYDVVVIGAGLRLPPPYLDQFEQLMNALHRLAPEARFAFNTRPDDSDVAALRQL